MSDWASNDDGWHVKNIKLDGADVGTPGSVAGWNNIGYYQPLSLDFGLALVGINGAVDSYGDVTAGSAVHVFVATLDGNNEWSSTDLSAISASSVEAT